MRRQCEFPGIFISEVILIKQNQAVSCEKDCVKMCKMKRHIITNSCHSSTDQLQIHPNSDPLDKVVTFLIFPRIVVVILVCFALL